MSKLPMVWRGKKLRIYFRSYKLICWLVHLITNETYSDTYVAIYLNNFAVRNVLAWCITNGSIHVF